MVHKFTEERVRLPDRANHLTGEEYAHYIINSHPVTARKGVFTADRRTQAIRAQDPSQAITALQVTKDEGNHYDSDSLVACHALFG